METLRARRKAPSNGEIDLLVAFLRSLNEDDA
jgi:hypothetical protein